MKEIRGTGSLRHFRVTYFSAMVHANSPPRTVTGRQAGASLHRASGEDGSAGDGPAAGKSGSYCGRESGASGRNAVGGGVRSVRRAPVEVPQPRRFRHGRGLHRGAGQVHRPRRPAAARSGPAAAPRRCPRGRGRSSAYGGSRRAAAPACSGVPRCAMRRSRTRCARP